MAAEADDVNRPVNWEGVRTQTDNDPELTRIIVEASITENRDGLDQMVELIQSGNTTELRRVAHVMRGSMRLFGASKAASLATELEARASEDVLEGTAELLSELRPLVEAILDELTRFIDTGEMDQG